MTLICLTEVLPKNSIMTQSDSMFYIDNYRIISSILKKKGITVYAKDSLKAVSSQMTIYMGNIWDPYGFPYESHMGSAAGLHMGPI